MNQDQNVPEQEPVPVVEDGYEAPAEGVEALGDEDESTELASAARALDGGPEEPDAGGAAGTLIAEQSLVADEELAGDLATVAMTGESPTGLPPGTTSPAASPVLAAYERDVHDVVVELKRVESDIRVLIEDRDPRRKRKLNGTHRWQELEDDVLSWRFTGRFEEPALRRVTELVGRRHYLFRHLRFLASTRPVWNS